jgi:hypothetical protein
VTSLVLIRQHHSDKKALTPGGLMRIILAVLFFVFTSRLYAYTYLSTPIYEIDMGQRNETPLIYLATGQVVTYPKINGSIIKRIKKGIKNRVWFSFKINRAREIIKLDEIDPPEQKNFRTNLLQEENVFSPSIIKNLDVARSYFYDARPNIKEESQCFNRAHVWAYEWRIKHNLYSSKIWLFFTRKFIRKYKFEWWFHVSPMIHVVIDDQVKERVLDIKYARGPLKQKDWTDIFMRDKANCPVIQKYSDQANFPESGSCFVMKSSMYYYRPLDLERKETFREEKTKWVENEVKEAFLEAFDITFGSQNEK